jgi:hypothetical protein
MFTGDSGDVGMVLCGLAGKLDGHMSAVKERNFMKPIQRNCS